MQLPEAFLTRMKQELVDEFGNFLASYENNAAYGLRVNQLFGAGSTIAPKLPFSLTPVPWCPEGFYADMGEKPGRHALHEAGAYYIQEPSAMCAIPLMDPKPGEIILDLCAAPGGKSTGLAGRMQDEGLLVANEIIPSRAKILSQNIERLGVKNAIVTNEAPDTLAEHFPLFFDKILVDTPCSGEGMFHKDDTAIQEWSPEHVSMCADRGAMILDYADTMLCPGGVLVYSTCTFAPAENEEQIQHFLTTHPEYKIEPWTDFIPENSGVSQGRISGTMRIWPHKTNGEGHFAVRLRKIGTSPSDTSERTLSSSKKSKRKKPSKKAFDMSSFFDFAKTQFPENFAIKKENLTLFGEELYLIPDKMNSLKGLKILRAGLHLGTFKKNRFEPSHALSKVILRYGFAKRYEVNIEDAIKYLHGETLLSNESNSPINGWTIITHSDYPLGFAKGNNGVYKNHYPKGLRIKY